MFEAENDYYARAYITPTELSKISDRLSKEYNRKYQEWEQYPKIEKIFKK